MPLEAPLVEVPIETSEGRLLSSNRRTPDDPSLLDLPIELRLLIYSYIFDDAVIEIRWSAPGNNRRDHWFVSDRNLRSHKFIDTSSIRPHIWRPRAQILGTCRQIRGEIISLKCYSLELNHIVGRYYDGLRRCLTPFLWSHVTTLSSSRCRQWLHCFQNRPPALRHYYVNKPFDAKPLEQTSDKFNGICTVPYVCWGNNKDIEAVKAGTKDDEIFTKMKSIQFDSRHSWVDAGTLLEGVLSGEQGNFALYARVRIVILPTSLDSPAPIPDARDHPSWYWLYPQLVLLAKWSSETNGEIVERHWRDDAKTGSTWECLSVSTEKCSCSNTYCSTTMDNEQYCEDWYGNVTGPPAWQEPRSTEDEIYPDGYCLFEN